MHVVWEPDRDLSDEVEALGIGHALEVVDHEHPRIGQPIEEGDQPSASGRGGEVRRRGGEVARAVRMETVQRRRHVDAEHCRIVVAVVRRQPGNRPRPEVGPLGQQGGLAVARRRDDDGDWCVGTRQPIEQRSATYDSSKRHGWAELRRSDLHRRHLTESEARRVVVGRPQTGTLHHLDVLRDRRHRSPEPENRRIAASTRSAPSSTANVTASAMCVSMLRVPTAAASISHAAAPDPSARNAASDGFVGWGWRSSGPVGWSG
jgi:hypothetical protein